MMRGSASAEMLHTVNFGSNVISNTWKFIEHFSSDPKEEEQVAETGEKKKADDGFCLHSILYNTELMSFIL